LELVEGEEGGSLPLCVRIVARAYPSDDKGLISLTSVCSNIEAFEGAAQKLRDEIDALTAQAKEAFDRLRTEEEKVTPIKALETVEEVWQAMEACAALEGMKDIFNPLDLEKRQEVANYIMTQTNIFKGAASIFSQHYDDTEFLLK
jgi:hypothetical protein